MNITKISIQRAFDLLFGSSTLLGFSKALLSVLVGGAIWILALIAKEQPPLGLVLNLLLMALTTGFTVRIMQQELFGGGWKATRTNTVPNDVLGELTEDVITGNRRPQLPRWSKPEFFATGLRLVIIENIYTIVTLLCAVAVVHNYGAQFSFNIFTSPILKQTTESVEVPWILMVFGALFSFYASLYLHLMPVHYAATGESYRSGCAFLTINRILWHALPSKRLRECLQSGLLIALAIGIGFMLLTALISQFAAVLTPILFFMQQVITANLWAQVYKIASEKIAAADTKPRNSPLCLG